MYSVHTYTYMYNIQIVAFMYIIMQPPKCIYMRQVKFIVMSECNILTVVIDEYNIHIIVQTMAQLPLPIVP